MPPSASDNGWVTMNADSSISFNVSDFQTGHDAIQNILFRLGQPAASFIDRDAAILIGVCSRPL